MGSKYLDCEVVRVQAGLPPQSWLMKKSDGLPTTIGTYALHGNNVAIIQASTVRGNTLNPKP